uniref:GDP-Man:Man(3)GlcNAc(2)-PP-Dol alpha-1,2-mannosyltransferase-like n=1 Tax=Styela clava TaxID=7725 RepID=UPI001939E7C4|nr:GDP-Man:Man(3)GlcNAc(2)-PP-Dol alpha-1,2-mannosyltransferase-like [Styela clava]
MHLVNLLVMMSTISLIIAATSCIIFLFGIYLLKFYTRLKKRKQSAQSMDKITIGFFHPYCNAGGGGERVLWCAVRALQIKYPDIRCIIYTGDYDASPEDILSHAKEKFNIVLPKKVDFIFLHKRSWVEAIHYPVFTLMGQSLGSMLLAYEAINSYIPDVFIDSMGYPFSYFIFKTIAGCKVGCYVHYPTISTDMLSLVSDRTGSFNNRAIIAKSAVLTNFKLMYYWFFAWCYGCAGARSDVVMVNSSWTKGHIEVLWGAKDDRPIDKIFPPCDIKAFLEIPLQRSSKNKIILSISQFRPEKNQALQVKSFARFLSTKPVGTRQEYQLVLAGGCRNQGDEKRVQELKSLAKQLGISDNVCIKVNISFTELKELLSSSQIGIHTMTNEHFGIGVVEFQAAGVIALAHNSGGPKMDIVVGERNQKTGFLAETVEEYAKAIENIFNLSPEEKTRVAMKAREACERFSEGQFEADFLQTMHRLLET